MIFIGYSSRDRYSIVEPMVFHIKNYGFHMWYDFHDMFLSDNRYHENFELGIAQSKYVIFIVSNNLFDSACAKEELKYAQTLYEKGEIVLFPILYLIKAAELPDEYNWIRKIIYNEINEQSGTLFVVNQILEKILHDKCNACPLRSFPEISNHLNKTSNVFLRDLIETYISLDIPNYAARMALLYAAYLYITTNSSIEFDAYICKTIKKTLSLCSLNISLDHLTFNLFQLAILLAFNEYLIMN